MPYTEELPTLITMLFLLTVQQYVHNVQLVVYLPLALVIQVWVSRVSLWHTIPNSPDRWMELGFLFPLMHREPSIACLEVVLMRQQAHL